MRERTVSRLAWGLWAVCVLSIALDAIATIARGSSNSWRPGDVAPTIATIAFLLAFSTVGALVASRQRRNPIGWLFLASAMCFLLGSIAVTVDPESRNVWAQWVSSWAWFAGVFLALPFTFLLFPDGHLPSPRWRTTAWIGGIGIGMLIAASMFAPGTIPDTHLQNPVGLDLFGLGEALVTALWVAATILTASAFLLSAASLVIRYRRSGPTQREQLRWLLFAAAVVLVSPVAQVAVGSSVHDPDLAVNIENAITGAVLTLIPIAVGIAILRYRLYDIDVVINKTVVYGMLAAFITVVYVGIVVVIGSLVGSSGSLPLSIIATAVVAVSFQPARERARQLANRLVYGKRASPYEALSEFSDRLADAYSPDDLLPRMARILGEATGATRADVWIRKGAGLRPEAVWPSTAPPGRSTPLTGGDLPVGMIPIRHQGDLLGALSIEKKPGETLSPAEESLVADLASQAGLVVRNVRLIEDLRSSRQRLVAAQDEERRKIERNIHDGAQQQLVALQVKLKLVDQMVEGDPPKAHEVISQMSQETAAALEDLRDLARGIYPPLLADKGLSAALSAQARKAAVPTTVEADGIGRFSQAVEATVYFCTLEALNNVAKYADASSVTVRLSNGSGELRFEITDDGTGFDTSKSGYGTGLQGMADRLAAIGGDLEVRSSPGAGTTVAGRVSVDGIQP